MNRRTVILLVLMSTLAASGIAARKVADVTAAVTRVYIRSDGSIDPPYAPISTLDNITYIFTGGLLVPLTCERDNIVIDGAGNTIHGLGNLTGIDLSYRTNVTVKNFNVEAFAIGIYLKYSQNITITDSNITDNTQHGIQLYEMNNDATILRNVLRNNSYALSLEDGAHTIFHNNFVDNTNDLQNFFAACEWDDGIEGNYWDKYTGADSDLDGRGDSAHVLDLSNQDNYPLMGPFKFYYAGTWDETSYYVHVTSNSTPSAFYFSPSEKTLGLNVTGPDGTEGISRIAIPRELLYSYDILDWGVRVNGASIPFGRQDSATHTYTFLTYSHSTLRITVVGTDVIPEFPMAAVAGITLFVLALGTALLKHRS